jgi:hypothetical protein
MSNMAYCRFENTLKELRDCYNNWDGELSPSETISQDKLIILCKKIAEEN